MNEVADNVEVAAEPAAEAPVDGSQRRWQHLMANSKARLGKIAMQYAMN